MIDRDAILRVLLDEAPDAERAAVIAHLAADPADAAFAERVRRAQAALDASGAMAPAFSVSPGLIRRLHAQAPSPRRGVANRLDAIAGAIVAVLRLDSWRSPAAVRGADGSRRLAFAADGIDVEVRLDPSPDHVDRFVCVGRVEGPGVSRVVWRGLPGGAEIFAEVDGDGFFDCVVEPGLARLEVLVGDAWVVTPAFEHTGGATEGFP